MLQSFYIKNSLGNASTINDGAAALVLMRESKAKAKGLKVIARIRSYADAAQVPPPPPIISADF